MSGVGQGKVNCPELFPLEVSKPDSCLPVLISYCPLLENRWWEWGGGVSSQKDISQRRQSSREVLRCKPLVTTLAAPGVGSLAGKKDPVRALISAITLGKIQLIPL